MSDNKDNKNFWDFLIKPAKPNKPNKPKQPRRKLPKKRPGIIYWIIDTIVTLAGMGLIAVVIIEMIMLLTD